MIQDENGEPVQDEQGNALLAEDESPPAPSGNARSAFPFTIMNIKQSQTATALQFLMVLSSDHITPATGLSPVVTLSKNSGSFAACAGAITEIGNGWYSVAGNATDSNTLGSLLLHATAATADPSDASFQVVAFDPRSSTNLGLSFIPAAVAAATELAKVPRQGSTFTYTNTVSSETATVSIT